MRLCEENTASENKKKTFAENPFARSLTQRNIYIYTIHTYRYLQY